MPLIFVLGRFSQQIRRNRRTHLYKRTPYTCNQTHLCQVRSCKYTPTPRYTSCFNSGMTSCLVLQILNRLPSYYWLFSPSQSHIYNSEIKLELRCCKVEAASYRWHSGGNPYGLNLIRWIRQIVIICSIFCWNLLIQFYHMNTQKISNMPSLAES